MKISKVTKHPVSRKVCADRKKNILLAAIFFAILTCLFICPLTSYAYTNNSNWSSTVKNYIVPQANSSFMNIHVDESSQQLKIEYYDKNYACQSTKLVHYDLSTFGCFGTDGTCYYLLTGQTNSNESNSVEVFRITKYDSSWNKLSSCNLNGANTLSPFAFGSARMTFSGHFLLIHTCHTMYKSGDGYNHQANVTIEVNTNTMTVTDAATEVSYNSIGYCSHSFNQFILTDGDYIVMADHGDAYPRSIVLCKNQIAFSSGKVTGNGSMGKYVNMLPISGTTGDNYTGATLGGFEISSDKYLVAGTSIDQNNFSSAKTQNVFISSVDRSLSGQPQITYLTNYQEGDSSAGTPALVKISDNRFVILWNKDNTVQYAELNAEGKLTGKIYSISSAALSDEQPAVIGNNIIWINTDSSNSSDLYAISLSNLSESSSLSLKKVMYRLYNPNSGEHFYTANQEEAIQLFYVGWSYEGIGWIAPGKSSKPVYRLYNSNSGDHHYTVSAGEKDSLVKIGWKYEGIGWYSGGSLPLYRQYNPNAKSGSHNYTTSKAENDKLVSVGWKAEGIGWYAIQ